MGSRGPQPKSATLHLLHGNPSKKPLAVLLDEFKPEVELPDVPSWCWPEAKVEFKRIAPELYRYGLISLLDRAALVRYLQAWAEYVWAKRELTREMKDAKSRRAKFEKDPANSSKVWSGGDGFQVPTPNGALTYSPYWVAAKRAGEEVDKALQAFGLSPAARARVRQSDQYPYLPGMEPPAAPPGDGSSPVTPAPARPTLASLSRQT